MQQRTQRRTNQDLMGNWTNWNNWNNWNWPNTRDMMIFGAGTPSACDRSRTVTPDCTETGPVTGATSRGVLGRAASRSRCC